VRGSDRLAKAAAMAALAIGVCLSVASPESRANGATPYLPLNLSPEIERQVERVLVLGGRAQLTRPIPIATVLEAMPQACQRDRVLCRRVRHYLNGYFGKIGVTEASVEVAAASHSTATVPNERGQRLDAPVDGSVVAFYRPYDHLLLQAGGVVEHALVQSTTLIRRAAAALPRRLDDQQHVWHQCSPRAQAAARSRSSRLSRVLRVSAAARSNSPRASW